jgi:type VI secretion system secreted protein VgrG
MAGGRARDYAPIEVSFSPDPGMELLFDGLHAEQELGRPFLFILEMSTGKLQTDVSKLIGATGSIWLYDEDADEQDRDRYFHGVVTRVVSAGLSGGAYRYRMELRPWVWLLSQVTDCRIFQDKSAFEIVTQIFRDNGFSDFKDKRQGGAGDIKLTYCVQYRETSLDFVTRLMEQFGFYYSFSFTKTAHTMEIADDPNAHPLLTGEIPYEFDQTELRTVKDHVWQWSTDMALNSGKWMFRDYNFETPSADLSAKTIQVENNKYGKFEVYEYPGPYTQQGDGQRLSDVRMQALKRQREVMTGLSNSRKLLTGQRFKLSNYPPPPDTPETKTYLIISTAISIGAAEGTPSQDAETLDTYRVTLHCIPGDTHFRLLRATPRPVIRGPQTAKVVGASGDEVMVDKYGRIKVKFHWDRSSTQDDQRTCWIRVAQSWAGATWGHMFIPRVGMEVVVEFLEGDPDRPLITGVVYNANNMAPYELPTNKTRSGWKTNSTTGGGGFNEFHFEDKKSAEEIYMHAERDWRREVKHDEIAKIENDHKVTTTNNDSLTVSSGNHSIDVTAGKSDVTAAQSITLTVGGSSIKIEPASITISSAMIKLQASGTMTIDGGGALTVTAGMVSIN